MYLYSLQIKGDSKKIKYKKCMPTFQAIGYKRMMQPTQVIFPVNHFY
jgi:hypothetical protein